jgi:hypothetical protein
VLGTVTGYPTVQAPNIGGALAASNATAATQQTALPTQSGNNDQPSMIIVECSAMAAAVTTAMTASRTTLTIACRIGLCGLHLT